ncbi:hypothetical protein ACH5RR_000160 [Cinchona calisaya]|uniref:Uncharacterized protein n=1 Tax=Cinchona calisaya TaxID=153742 RepID=A0ABD3B0S3_9GENT
MHAASNPSENLLAKEMTATANEMPRIVLSSCVMSSTAESWDETAKVSEKSLKVLRVNRRCSSCYYLHSLVLSHSLYNSFLSLGLFWGLGGTAWKVLPGRER